MTRSFVVISCAIIFLAQFGELVIAQQINSVAATKLPPHFLARPKANDQPLDLSRLRRTNAGQYILAAGDTLAVFVEGVLGELDETPPVQLPSPGSDLPPAIGYPVPVLGDGSISLPYRARIPIHGLTVIQAEAAIRNAYLDGQHPILSPRSRVLVSLLRERTHRVTVIREDRSFDFRRSGGQTPSNSRPVADRSDRSGRATVMQMPAYKNDLFSALLRSGGLPGLNANPDIRIQRAQPSKVQIPRGREFPRTSINSDSSSPASVSRPSSASGMTIISTRMRPGQMRSIGESNVALGDNDIVYVDSRQTEVYYTGGLLGGGEFLLPRDSDLDVLQAVARAGRTVGGNTGLLGRGPSELVVIRRLPENQQVAIRVDLNRALTDPAERILVAAGDTLILRNKPQQKLGNLGIGLFNTYGLRQLLR